MKRAIFILFFLISIQSFGQSRNYVDCETARIEAKKSSKKGIYIVQIYRGLHEYYDTNFDNLYKVYLYSKYGILFEINYCSQSDETCNCYFNEIEKLVVVKYGKNFLEKTHKEFKNKFNSMSLKEKQSIIDENKVYECCYYFEIDSPVKYIGNDIELEKLIKDKLKEYQIYEDKSGLKLIINKNGEINSIEYSNKDSISIPFDKEKMIEFLNKHTKFVPAYLINEKVNSVYSFFFET